MMSAEDMQDVFSNIMVVTTLMLTLVVSVFGTVPMSDLMLWDYRSAMLWKAGFREFVVAHLTEKKDFNFTQQVAPGLFIDLREVLLHPTENDILPHGNMAGSHGERTNQLDFAFHMTKDFVDPWVMGTVAQTPDHGSATIAWCYTVSAICFTICLLTAFFHYMAIIMSNVGEKRDLAEKSKEAKKDKHKQIKNRNTNTQIHKERLQSEDILELEKTLEGELKRLESKVRETDIGLYVYTMGWLLVLASIVGMVIFFIGLGNLTRARYPQLAATQHVVFFASIDVGAPLVALGVFSGLLLQCCLGQDLWREVYSPKAKP